MGDGDRCGYVAPPTRPCLLQLGHHGQHIAEALAAPQTMGEGISQQGPRREYVPPAETQLLTEWGARWPWQQCRAVANTPGGVRRCDLRRGHPVAHVNERGFDVLCWREALIHDLRWTTRYGPPS